MQLEAKWGTVRKYENPAAWVRRVAIHRLTDRHRRLRRGAARLVAPEACGDRPPPVPLRSSRPCRRPSPAPTAPTGGGGPLLLGRPPGPGGGRSHGHLRGCGPPTSTRRTRNPSSPSGGMTWTLTNNYEKLCNAPFLRWGTSRPGLALRSGAVGLVAGIGWFSP